MPESGTDPESYITEYNLVYEEKMPGLTKLVSPTMLRQSLGVGRVVLSVLSLPVLSVGAR